MPQKILLVDDSPTVLKILTMGLSQNGYAVNTAGDGLEALSMMGGTQYDILITDINMPKMDGLTLIRTVRSLTRYKGLLIIALSTESAPHDKDTGRQAGVDRYLTKPVSMDRLIKEIKTLSSQD
ncbi:response regulator [Dethiosulfatarculus sandiegensis]|uniref:Chemotaxis protein CheY n=1 Tax=Dethiosulfatarculus sandiegensis TaxID=1429043 RepID=A0A0D2HY74_9BACT|nr:response regulator [Dethiosulfatarculus sandiegensis]KIX15268.1 chemotaxis protein CheY [Dethiosulfatarculus sandiegensis]